jgi:hypothetical protein
MRLFPLTLTSLVALLSHNSVVKANFDLYSGFLNYYDGNQQAYYRMWQIFDSDPSCNDVFNTRYVYNTDDVSGGTLGVRCEAGWNNAGCYGHDDPISITTLEMHFSNSPLFHWSKLLTPLP